jgi:hypothetical protein
VAKNFFYYRLYAIDLAHNRSESADLVYARMPDVVAPQQPFIREVRQSDNTLVVEWIPNTDGDLMGYHIYRFGADKEPVTATQLNASLLDAKVFRFTDRFPTPNVPYKYYLTATDSSGNVSMPSGYYGGLLVKGEGSAVNVRQLKAKYNKRRKVVELVWGLEDENNPDYKGCVVYRRMAEGNFTPISSLDKTVKYRDKSLAPGERHYYQVRTYTASGYNARSITVEVEIPKE